jgi:hypothetical protein
MNVARFRRTRDIPHLTCLQEGDVDSSVVGEKKIFAVGRDCNPGEWVVG